MARSRCASAYQASTTILKEPKTAVLTLDKGKDLSSASSRSRRSMPSRVAEAHRRGVFDPMTASLVRVRHRQSLCRRRPAGQRARVRRPRALRAETGWTMETVKAKKATQCRSSSARCTWCRSPATVIKILHATQRGGFAGRRHAWRSGARDAGSDPTFVATAPAAEVRFSYPVLEGEGRSRAARAGWVVPTRAVPVLRDHPPDAHFASLNARRPLPSRGKAPMSTPWWFLVRMS